MFGIATVSIITVRPAGHTVSYINSIEYLATSNHTHQCPGRTYVNDNDKYSNYVPLAHIGETLLSC